ncbi:DnaJ-like subfamily B member 8 [Spatholobus suberectus]|nr:DnaJ-like subfamily B member 8 [Spatholobus suberectus]
MEAHREGSSYYNVLGVSSDSNVEEIRRAYRKLAMQWHPDRWTRTPSLLGEAKRRFQQIQEAYSVLSDRKKRTMYDAGLFDPLEEADEGFSDFVEEMLSLMAQVRREKKHYGLEELQAMLMEMAEGFDSPSMYCGIPSLIDESRGVKRMRFDDTMMENRG